MTDRSLNQTELRQFLAACRSRLQPGDVGLPAHGRRRVPGLRREEVAELVDVSVNWYAEFEAGKSNRRFSPAFVQRVADALHLDNHESVLLFRLTLPEADAVAKHFDVALSDAEESLNDARAAAGRSVASAICRELIARETLRDVQAAAGRAIAAAVYDQLVAQTSLHDAQAATGRVLASEIYRGLLEREALSEAPRSKLRRAFAGNAVRCKSR